MILEGRMKVRLREVACVTGLGEKTEIGQLQAPDLLRHLREQRPVRLPHVGRVEEHQADGRHAEARDNQADTRFSTRLPATVALLSVHCTNQGS